MSQLRVEKRAGILVLTLDDPARRNVLSRDIGLAISRAVKDATDDPAINFIIVTGAGSAFCAGADIEDLKAAARGEVACLDPIYAAFLDIANSPLPTLAAVNGPAVGAGMNLALACDMRLAADSASFDTRFLQIGLHPGGGHAWMLLRAVGWQTASRMLLCGEVIGGHEAVGLGLAIGCVPSGELNERAVAIGGRAARTSRELLLRTKATMRRAVASDHDSAFRHETLEQQWSLGQPAFADLIRRLEQRIGAGPAKH